MARWSELNEWAYSVKNTFVSETDDLTAVTYDNSSPAILLSRAAYLDGIGYSFSTLEYVEHGPLEPADVDAAPYVERLIRNAKYEYVDTENTPDGEYIVMDFPDEDMRLDFFRTDVNLVRMSDGEGENPQLFKAALAEGEAPATDIAQEWVDALASANGLN